MERINKIDDTFIEVLRTSIRDSNTTREVLQNDLYNLGSAVARYIIGVKSEQATVTTPLEEEYIGRRYMNSANIIMSTKDDLLYFASGIGKNLPNSKLAYMNFQGVRGIEALNAEIRDVELPDVKHAVDSVIIAKAVLATGCTAIVLAKKAIEKYNPKELIIASAFHSKEGVGELLEDIPTAKIILLGNADRLEKSNGFLVPGVGNLDDRIKNVA